MKRKKLVTREKAMKMLFKAETPEWMSQMNYLGDWELEEQLELHNIHVSIGDEVTYDEGKTYVLEPKEEEEDEDRHLSKKEKMAKDLAALKLAEDLAAANKLAEEKKEKVKDVGW